MRGIVKIFSFVVLLVPSLAYSLNEYPTNGVVHNATEASALAYECTLTDPMTLDCEFVQTSLRNNKTKSDAEKELNEVMGKKIDWEKESNPKQCSEMSEYLSYLEGTKKPQNDQKNKIDTLTDIEKSEQIALIKVYVKVCKTHRSEDLRALVKMSLDKDVRSCKISTNKFRQTFQVVSDGLQSKIWVVKGDPSGECGIVQLSRFVPITEVIGESKFVNWNYVAKKIVTNRNGKTLFGGACTDFDESEYEYDWHSKTWTKGCDYIEFSY
jgi:uncharacterized protein YnzC (UPF0291/DUF896 family)